MASNESFFGYIDHGISVLNDEGTCCNQEEDNKYREVDAPYVPIFRRIALNSEWARI